MYRCYCNARSDLSMAVTESISRVFHRPTILFLSVVPELSRGTPFSIVAKHRGRNSFRNT